RFTPMVETVQGAGVLLLLSVFLAYLLAPGVAAIRRGVRGGRPKQPVSVLACIYGGVFLPAAIVWHLFNDRVTEWVRVTAPQSVDRLFSGGDLRTIDASLNRAPLTPILRTT